MGQPHTGHNAVFTGTRQTRPTKKVTFPRNKAEKSPFQQHDLSILIVGPNQLKHRLSRTRKPKSYPSSNTQCPITRISNGRPTDVEGVRWSGRQSCGATVPAGGGRARPCNDPKHLATRQRTRQHPCRGRRRARAAGPGAGNTSGVTQPHPAAHAPPRRHRDAAVLTPVGHNKTAQPQWGRAAVAVALGFEPRVAVTPHSISSAAPSAARTRYLTRILYYRNPRATQIDPPWEQRHTQREPRSRRSS